MTPRLFMKRSCKLKGTILLLLLFILFPSPGMGEILYIRNALPVFSSAAPPLIEEAGLQDSLSLETGYSSTFVVKDSDEWSYHADIETLTVDLVFRKKVFGEYELSAVIPFLINAAGFMDSFLEGYHDLFGFPDYGRSRRPLNDFMLEVKRSGETVLRGRNGDPGPGDIRIGLKRRITSGNPVVSLKGFVELPTGSPSGGFGNGEFDLGAKILLDYEILRDFMFHLNLGYTIPGDMGEMELEGFVSAAAGWSYPLTKRLTGVIEVMMQESPLEKTGIAELDRASVILTFGGLFDAGEGRIAGISLSEDLNTAGAPDFTLNLSVKFRF